MPHTYTHHTQHTYAHHIYIHIPHIPHMPYTQTTYIHKAYIYTPYIPTYIQHIHVPRIHTLYGHTTHTTSQIQSHYPPYTYQTHTHTHRSMDRCIFVYHAPCIWAWRTRAENCGLWKVLSSKPEEYTCIISQSSGAQPPVGRKAAEAVS